MRNTCETIIKKSNFVYMRSRYWFNADAPEAAMPPASSTSASVPNPGQPLAPKNAPPTAASNSKATIRSLNRTTIDRAAARQRACPPLRL